jgi:hypothetical protein
MLLDRIGLAMLPHPSHLCQIFPRSSPCRTLEVAPSAVCGFVATRVININSRRLCLYPNYLRDSINASFICFSSREERFRGVIGTAESPLASRLDEIPFSLSFSLLFIIAGTLRCHGHHGAQPTMLRHNRFLCHRSASDKALRVPAAPARHWG